MIVSPNDELFLRVTATTAARHIKLGEGGKNAAACFERDKLYIGFFSGDAGLPPLTQLDENKWKELRAKIDRREYKNEASLTSAINQVKMVAKDDGKSLWFTFYGAKLYWTFIDPESPMLPWEGGHGTYRRTIGWRCTDLKDKPIDEGQVTTRISQVRAYQGTVRAYIDREDGIEFNPVEYLRNRILGKPQQSEIAAREAQFCLEGVVEELIIRLTDKEFENFVDLIFVGDGWQRVTEVGGNMADIDGQYEHATSGATAKVQCKSSMSMDRLDNNPMMSDGNELNEWIYWAYHSPDSTFESKVDTKYGKKTSGSDLAWHPFPFKESQGRLYFLNRRKLAELAVRKGLVGWLRHKAC